MKRSFSKTEDTSIRPVSGRESRMPVPRPGSVFRFPSETNYQGQQTQSLPISNSTHANFQAATSRVFTAVANQVRPNPVAQKPGMPWSWKPNVSQINRQLSGCQLNSANTSLQFIPRPLMNPRYFTWGNPVNNWFPRTPQLFQEPRRGWNFVPFRQTHSAQPRFRNSAKQAKYLMNRKWQFLPEGETCCSANDFTFSVVSYNVLSDELLFENKYLYEECNEEVLGWEYRKENLLKELLSYNADVLCLQEVDAGHYLDWFQPQLNEAGYSGVYNQRSGTKPDGCVTFYRNSKFSLLNKKLVKYYTKDVRILDKDNVGIVVLLKPNIQDTNRSKDEPTLLCVANTHLLFNKKRGDIKLAQLAYLFAEIDSLAVLSSDSLNIVHCPIVLCGDFNSLPHSPLYNFITTGQLDYSIRCPAVISGQLMPSQVNLGPSARSMEPPLLPWTLGITLNCQWRKPQDEDKTNSSSDVERSEHEGTTVLTSSFQFESVYKHKFDDGIEEVTTCHFKACCNVDYIFYTPGTRERTVLKNNKRYTQRGTLTVLGKLDLIRKADFHIIKQLPNSRLSSDHIALHALFKLT